MSCHQWAWVVLVLTATPVWADSTLRMKFVKGETNRYDLVNRQVMETPAQGNQPASKSVVEQQLRMAKLVIEVKENGSARVKETIESFRLSVDNTNGTNRTAFTFDSTKQQLPTDPQQKAMVEPLMTMLGAEYQMSVDTQNRITEIVVPKKVLEGLSKAPNSGAMGSLATEEGMKRALEQGSVSFPDGAVKPGAYWQRPIDVKLPFGALTTTTTYIYDGTTPQKLEQLSAKIEVKLEKAAGSPFQVEVKALEGTGRFFFDNQAGKLRESSVHQKIAVTSEPNGVKTTQVVTTDVSLKWLPPAPAAATPPKKK